MKLRPLVVTREGNGWCVRLDGVDVVGFFGPHAQEWAVREREELAQLLDAQPYDDSADRDNKAHRLGTPQGF
jgi:hypothetical protein